MVVHLCVKFQDSSIILTSFRQGRGLGGNFTPKNELLKSPLRLGLIIGFFKKILKISVKQEFTHIYLIAKIEDLSEMHFFYQYQHIISPIYQLHYQRHMKKSFIINVCLITQKIIYQQLKRALCKKCPYSELF